MFLDRTALPESSRQLAKLGRLSRTARGLPLDARRGLLRGVPPHVLQLLQFHSSYLLTWLRLLALIIDEEAQLEVGPAPAAPVLLLVAGLQRRVQEALGNGGPAPYRPPELRRFQEADIPQCVPELNNVTRQFMCTFDEIDYKSDSQTCNSESEGGDIEIHGHEKPETRQSVERTVSCATTTTNPTAKAETVKSGKLRARQAAATTKGKKRRSKLTTDTVKPLTGDRGPHDDDRDDGLVYKQQMLRLQGVK